MLAQRNSLSPAEPVGERRYGTDLVLEARVPKFHGDELSVEVSNGVLTLRAEKQEDGPKGRVYRSFARSIELPRNADEANIQADLRNGTLTVIVPRCKDARARRIPISVCCPMTGEQEWACPDEDALETLDETRPKVQRRRPSQRHASGREVTPARALWNQFVEGVMGIVMDVNQLLDRIVMSGTPPRQLQRQLDLKAGRREPRLSRR